MLTKKNPLREIERKFLLKRLPDGLANFPHAEIEQGYLALEEEVQVRLRKKGRVRWLTFKRGNKTSREEREVQLSEEQFDALWPATGDRRLSKIRYDVPYKKYIVEVDVYTGRHDGLVVAEVEFPDEESCRDFIPPDWLGEEVTGRPRYSNIVLALQPP